MSERWLVELLDRQERSLGPLGRITGGSLDWSISRSIHGGGTIEVANVPDDIDWLTARLRISHSNGGTRTRMGTWIPVWPEWTLDGPEKKASITLLDKLALLSQPTGIRQQYGATTHITRRVVDLIKARGEDKIAITPSEKTTSAPLTWDPTESWLRVINDLLEVAGYGALWCDRNGWFRAEPWVPPEDRPERGIYGGQAQDHRVLRQYRDSANLADTPNVIFAYSRGDSGTDGLRGRASLDDPNNPLSTANRGEIVKVVQGLEAADQSVINQRARRLLASSTAVTRKVTFTHPVDDTSLRDRVTLRRLDVTGAIVERRIRLGVGPVVEDTIRHIYTGGRLWT